MTPKWSPKSPNWSPKMMPIWLYRQDFAKFSLNRHHNISHGHIPHASDSANRRTNDAIFVASITRFSGAIPQVSPTATRRSFQARFNVPKGSDGKTIRTLFAKFLIYDLVGNVGRTQTAVTPQNAATVSELFSKINVIRP
ncbi:DUF4817 domain-containing protein [Trichonephila clavipes]|nr:DUF4817 domain-containing protein [Trichonephila clavipes]